MISRFAVVLLALVLACEARNLRRHNKREIEQCTEDTIQTVDVDLNELTGVWYKVLHKGAGSGGGKTSFVLKNELNGGDKLDMTEYYTKDENCEGPVSGEWTKPDTGKLHLKINPVDEETFEIDVNIVYHYKHPRLNDEQVIALYACKKVESDGTCNPDNRVGCVLSKNRRPFAHSLFYAAKALQNACLDPKTLTRLNTLTSCGDELLEEDDQYGDSSEESSEDPCNVDNIQGNEIDPDDILAGNKYYLIAVHEGYLTKTGVTMMNIEYKGEQTDGKLKTYTKFVQHGVCLKGEMEEWVDPNDPTVWKIKTVMRSPSGPKTVNISMKFIYEKNGVMATYWCVERDPVDTEKCKTARSAIWATTPYVRLGQLSLALAKLRGICVNPKKMVFMSTTAHCPDYIDVSTHTHSEAEIAENQRCKVETITGTPHFQLSKLEGVWYAAGSVGNLANVLHANLLAAVVKRTTTDDPNVLNTEGYVNLKDGTCFALTGTVKLVDPENAVIEHEVTATIKGKTKTMKHRTTVLHAGSQMSMYYMCKEENEDGTCKTPYIRIDSKSREIQHRYIQNLEKHIDKTCIDGDSINWFFMHSQCGKELDPPFSQRHGYLALSHTDTMEIITKFSSPMCKVSDIKGQKVCFQKFAEAGPWYSLAMYDAKWADFRFYGSVSRISNTGNGTSTAREYAVFDGGDGKTCHEVKAEMYQENVTDPKDVIYMARFTMFGQEYNIQFKYVWTNYRVGVGYWCRRPSPDGTCPSNEVSVYAMANHETIDHAEWLLIEQIIRSLCVDPALLRHMTSHELCLIEQAKTGNVMYPPKKNCNWENFKGLPFTPETAEGVYHTMAFASRSGVDAGLKSRTYTMEKQDDDNIKITMKSTYAGNEQCLTKEMTLTRGDSATNEWTTTVELNGEETPVSIWLSHSVGPYSVLIGCTGADCDETTGFVYLESHYRANDKIAIQDTYAHLAENCVNPDWLTTLDSHNDCGGDLDTKSCVVADFQGLTEYNVDDFNGIWYLTAHTNQRYSSLKCKTETGDPDDDEVAATCYAKMGERCVGPSAGKFSRDQSKPGQITYTFSGHGRSYSQDYYFMYADANFALMVGCKKLSADGSCLTSRTSVMLWSKSYVGQDGVPSGVKDKLKEVCVHESSLKYLSETDCGSELS